MDPDRTVDPAADSNRAQLVPQRIALGNSDHILVEDVSRLRTACRKRQRQTGETRLVTIRDGLSLRIVGCKSPELDAKNCRLDCIETRIDARAGADIPV